MLVGIIFADFAVVVVVIAAVVAEMERWAMCDVSSLRKVGGGLVNYSH